MTPTTAAAPQREPAKIPVQVYLFLAAGIVAVSLASIFIRYAFIEGMPSALVAAGRLTISALMLAPFALLRHRPELATLSRADFLLAVAAGFFLAIHFATWIASLEYTSVLISVVFVTTNPLWVALLEFVFLRQPLRRFIVIGLIIAFVGGVLIGIGGEADPADDSGQAVLGAALALAGAISIAIYLVIGRKVRAKLTLVPYVWLVYSIAAVFLIINLLLTATPVIGYSVNGYLLIVLLALVPQLIGHTSFNYALRYLPATLIGIITQIEPIGSAVAALILFQELPLPLQIFGSGLILVGVILATRGQSQKS
mgnify:CR=1 FL=1|jgi:drug/metabolite transporter (DMT)-like permease